MWAHGKQDHELVETYMRELAAMPLEGTPRTDPSVLWWKAQLLRRWDAERQVTRPLEVGERVQVGISLTGSVLLLAWMWRAFEIASASLMLTTVVTTGGVLLAAAALLTAWGALARD